jgi:organic hydroperoxide reductase OsmC/OhrA
MKIEAHLSNTRSGHIVEVATDGRRQSIDILPKAVGQGSNINGGELLLAALATCFCNDLYREAAIQELISATDSVVEIHNTIRRGCTVRLMTSVRT